MGGEHARVAVAAGQHVARAVIAIEEGLRNLQRIVAILFQLDERCATVQAVEASHRARRRVKFHPQNDRLAEAACRDVGRVQFQERGTVRQVFQEQLELAIAVANFGDDQLDVLILVEAEPQACLL